MILYDFKEELHKKLRDPEYAAYYLQGALEDSPVEFYYALRELVIAHGGVETLSKKLGRGRCSLYKSLSREGRPLFETVNDVLQGVGFRLAVVPDKSDQSKEGVVPA